MANACQECAKRGSFWEGSPQGQETKVGIDAYISKPTGGISKAVLLIPDVFGWDASNTRLLADRFAAAGFIAVLADYFHGDNPPVAELKAGNAAPFMAWREKHPANAVLADIDKVLAALKQEHSITSVGALGICWGGLHTALLASGNKIKAGVINHGSFVTEEEVKAITKPILFNASKDDQQIPVERLEAFKAILKEKPDVPSDVKLFQQTHGWTVRGDENDPKLAEDIEGAFTRARDWFQKYL